MQVYPIFLPNRGIKLDAPEQFLQNAQSPDSKNMEFYNELLQGRSGLSKFDTFALSGPVLLEYEFRRISGTRDVLFWTTKDIYLYDFGNSRFDILTPIYSTGTIEVQVGTPTIVRGTGTGWTADNVRAGDFIRLSAGGTYTTAQTWYEVLSLNVGSQQITLTTSAPTTAAGTSYALRQTYSGSTTDMWQCIPFLDDILGEVVVATNGVDTPVLWTGTGQFRDVANLATGFTAAKYVTQYSNRIFFIWTVEGGQDQPIRARCSEVANCESYDDLAFQDFEKPDASSWFKGACLVNDYLILPKEDGCYVGRPITDLDNPFPFNFEFASEFEGNFSAYSIVVHKRGLFYYGTDDRFHYFNLVNDSPVFEEILPYLNTIDPDKVQYIYGAKIENKNQIRWLLPYDSVNELTPCVVYDYKNDVVEIWEYQGDQWLRCFGSYLNTVDLYVDDPIWGDYYVDEQNGFWDDRVFLANAPVILIGREDGYVLRADQGQDDDGLTYTRKFRLKRQDFGIPQERKRLWKQQHWLEAETAGDVTVSLYKDDNTSPEVTTKTISLINSGKDMVKKQVTWDKEFENSSTMITSTNFFAYLGQINWFEKKRKTVA